MKHIPYGRHQVTQSDIDAVERILREEPLTQGETVPAFERALARRFLASEAIALNSATSCLHVACLALGVKEGDWVWTSPNSFVASSNCALYCGARVDFVDIDPLTGLMDEKKLEKKIEEARRENRLPKVVIPVHFAGTSCNMEQISSICRENGIRIVEDASHAVGGSYKGEPIGSCRYSDITVFSFHPVKIITTGEGGAALTNNAQLAEAMRLLRSHGITKDRERFAEEPAGPWVYEQQVLGFNYRMSDIHAALGLSQLKRLDAIVDRRNEIRSDYIGLLHGLPVRLLEIPKNCRSSVHLVVVSLMGCQGDAHRIIFEGMRNAGIGVQLHYSPIHLQPYYRAFGYSKGYMKNAEEYSSSSFSLPAFPDLTDREQSYVVETLEGLVKKEL